MSVYRYSLLQEIEGQTYGHEICATSVKEAKEIAKLLGAKYQGAIVEKELVCDECLQPLQCIDCLDSTEWPPPKDDPYFNQ